MKPSFSVSRFLMRGLPIVAWKDWFPYVLQRHIVCKIGQESSQFEILLIGGFSSAMWQSTSQSFCCCVYKSAHSSMEKGSSRGSFKPLDQNTHSRTLISKSSGLDFKPLSDGATCGLLGRFLPY